MPVLAVEINQKFHEYTGYNKCMTLSAAICMANGNGHISTLAEETVFISWMKPYLGKILRTR